MEHMRIKVVECRRALTGVGMSALVFVFSERQCEGEPEVRMLMRLSLPEGATSQAAYDLALRYLDVA